ncbi:MAG: hypothetical protein KDC98_18345 [Planctomycetes bacterium]|nr:hypothetical protein [Planctomycetota bacterium]
MTASACLLPMALGQTYIVDSQNGPGTQFATIEQAVATVADGATLVVRAGTYGRFGTSKGLAILGEAGARLDLTGQLPVLISNLPAHRRFAMRGIELVCTTNQWMFSVANNQGGVILDFPPAAPVTGEFRIAASERVQIRGLAIDNAHFAAVDVQHSAVSLVDCDLRSGTHLAIRQQYGWLQLTACLLHGSGGIYPLWNSANVIGVTGGGRIELRGCTLVGPAGGSAFAYGVSGEGSAYLDNNTVLTDIYQLSGLAVGNLQLLNAHWSDMAKCTASTGPAGTTATASAQGPAASVMILFAGFPARPSWPTAVAYPLWLDPGTTLTIGVGIGTVTGGYVVPAAPWVSGLGVGWQALAYDTTTGLQLSNAAAYVHGP